MKVGDIKVEAIKLMFANYGFDMGIEDLSKMLADENYSSYIVNMNGSIARALDRIENACVMPVKRKEITLSECDVVGNCVYFDLSKVDDLFLIDRVSANYGKGCYCGNIGFELEGNLLILPQAQKYTILYYPTIKTMNSSVLDNEEMWIPDKLARLIPYFIKGDLYQEEEPALASDARNIFESSLDDLKKPTQSKQDYVHKVFRMF